MDRTKGITVSSWPVLFLLPLLIVSIHGAAEARATAGAETGRPKQVPAGTWGGKGVLLDVREDGARIELVCAHGTIDGPIKLEKDESFHARGLYLQEHPGPQWMEEETEGRPAIYAGGVQGKEMTLTLRLEDTQEEVGTFTLVLGRSSRLTKCR